MGLCCGTFTLVHQGSTSLSTPGRLGWVILMVSSANIISRQQVAVFWFQAQPCEERQTGSFYSDAHKLRVYVGPGQRVGQSDLFSWTSDEVNHSFGSANFPMMHNRRVYWLHLAYENGCSRICCVLVMKTHHIQHTRMLTCTCQVTQLLLLLRDTRCKDDAVSTCHMGWGDTYWGVHEEGFDVRILFLQIRAHTWVGKTQ